LLPSFFPLFSKLLVLIVLWASLHPADVMRDATQHISDPTVGELLLDIITAALSVHENHREHEDDPTDGE